MKYIVKLMKNPKEGKWPKDHFPVQVKYKKDAVQLVEEVRAMGGVALYGPVNSPTEVVREY